MRTTTLCSSLGSLTNASVPTTSLNKALFCSVESTKKNYVYHASLAPKIKDRH